MQQQETDKSAQTKAIKVNYNSVEALVEILEGHQIGTIISCIYFHDENTRQAQQQLIETAQSSSVTRRFVTGEFAAMVTPAYVSFSHLFLGLYRVANNIITIIIESLCYSPHLGVGTKPQSFSVV